MKHREKVKHMLALKDAKTRIGVVRGRLSGWEREELWSALRDIGPVFEQLRAEVRNAKAKR